MEGTRLYLFDDARARAWRPFRLTRPVGELLFGCLRLRERAEKAFGMRAAGHLAGDDLLGFADPSAPPALAVADVPSDAPRVLLSSRAVIEPAGDFSVDRVSTLVIQGHVAGWALPAGAAAPAEEALLDPEGTRFGGTVELAGTFLEWPWSLIEANPARIAADVLHLHRGSHLFGLRDVQMLGDNKVFLGQDSQIEPGVLLDLREGPVRLDDGVRVQAPARLTGPLFVGRDSVILGGSVGTSSIGPVSKVRGEVEASVLLGYCNKAHDGYLGHSLVGEWVNLGALTTNSDLKNNYGSVRVRLSPEERMDTGLLKVGCFLGDHVKTGIGTLLNTGTVVGAGSNLFGGHESSGYIPPFSWDGGEGEPVEFRLEKLLEVAEAAMARRGVQLSGPARAFLTKAWERSRSERRQQT